MYLNKNYNVKLKHRRSRFSPLQRRIRDLYLIEKYIRIEVNDEHIPDVTFLIARIISKIRLWSNVRMEYLKKVENGLKVVNCLKKGEMNGRELHTHASGLRWSHFRNLATEIVLEDDQIWIECNDLEMDTIDLRWICKIRHYINFLDFSFLHLSSRVHVTRHLFLCFHLDVCFWHYF